MVSACHHVGCLVYDIAVAVNDYLILFPAAHISEVYEIAEQKVKVCFFTAPGINIEFVQPQDEQSSLYRLLKRNPGFYHVGVLVKNIEDEIARLGEHGYRKINLFRSPVFNNRYCSFLYNNEMHLIELIEQEL